MRVEEGKKYWYINDKFQLVSDIEKNNQTSTNRLLAGNYFTSNASGLEVVGQITEIIRDYLATLSSEPR